MTMQDQPGLKSESIALTTQGPNLSEDLSPQAPKRIVTISIAAAESDCSFWIGLFQEGSSSPSELYGCASVTEMLERAATSGIAGKGEPLMLSDTSTNPPRYVYFVPVANPSAGLSESIKDELVRTVGSWSPGRAGVYLAPELCGENAAADLLLELLTRFVEAEGVSEFFLLPGHHGLNSLLNAALRLKFDLEGEDLDIRVFH